MRYYTLIQIRKKLLKIKSLTAKERDLILNELEKYTSDGISYSELHRTILKLRKEYRISEIDGKYLRELLEQLEK